jgi:hypothetical protein
MLVDQEVASVPLFDTTRIYAEKAVEMALHTREPGVDGRHSDGSTHDVSAV